MGSSTLVGIHGAQVHVVLMDVRMPGMGGIECTRRLRALRPAIKIVIVTGLEDSETVRQSLNAGATYFLAKPFAPAQCRAAIRTALLNSHSDPPTQEVVRGSADARVSSHSSGMPRPALTARETEILSLLARGRYYKEIADYEKLSLCTIRNTIHQLYLRLNAHNRDEALRNWKHEV